MWLRKPIARQYGLSLLELLLSLSVVAAVILVSARYFYSAGEGQKQTQLVAQVGATITAVQNYMRNRSADPARLTIANGVKVLVDEAGLRPLYEHDPWGGRVTVAVNGNLATMVFADVPDSSCEIVRDRLLRTVNADENSPLSSESVNCRAIGLTVRYHVF